MDNVLGSIVTAILAGLAIYATVSLIIYIILVIANWKIFTKAGEAGWKSLIPFLNTYVIFKISWEARMFWIMMCSLIAGSICSTIAGEDGGVVAILGLMFSIVSIVIGIVDIHKLSKSFGHGIGFTLGLIFFSPIFTLILGFGSSKYIGPNGEGTVDTI